MKTKIYNILKIIIIFSYFLLIILLAILVCAPIVSMINKSSKMSIRFNNSGIAVISLDLLFLSVALLISLPSILKALLLLFTRFLIHSINNLISCLESMLGKTLES